MKRTLLTLLICSATSSGNAEMSADINSLAPFTVRAVLRLCYGEPYEWALSELDRKATLRCSPFAIRRVSPVRSQGVQGARCELRLEADYLCVPGEHPKLQAETSASL